MNRRCHCGKKLKNARRRLCGECSKYFELWGKLCEARGWKKSDDAKRKTWHAMAGLDAEKSHTKFAHGEFTRLFNWTRQQLAGDADLGAAMEAANPEIGERRMLVRGIEDRLMEMVFGPEIWRRADERDAVVKEAQKYLAPILESAFQYSEFVTASGWRAWRELPMGLLRTLSMTVTHRWRAKAGGGSEGLRVESEELAEEMEPPDIAGEVPPEDEAESEAWWEQEQRKEDDAAEREAAEVAQDYQEPF